MHSGDKAPNNPTKPQSFGNVPYITALISTFLELKGQKKKGSPSAFKDSSSIYILMTTKQAYSHKKLQNGLYSEGEMWLAKCEVSLGGKLQRIDGQGTIIQISSASITNSITTSDLHPLFWK